MYSSVWHENVYKLLNNFCSSICLIDLVGLFPEKQRTRFDRTYRCVYEERSEGDHSEQRGTSRSNDLQFYYSAKLIHRFQPVSGDRRGGVRIGLNRSRQISHKSRLFRYSITPSFVSSKYVLRTVRVTGNGDRNGRPLRFRYALSVDLFSVRPAIVCEIS